MSDIANKKSLVAVQGTTQFVAALVSLCWYERTFNLKANAVLLIYDTSVPEENEPLMVDAILKLATIRTWADIIIIKQQEMSALSYNRYPACISKLISILKGGEFQVIFVARNFGSFGTHLLLNAYPNATRIEYGDSFGLVGNEAALSISVKDFFKTPVLIVKSVIKTLLFSHFPKRFKIDHSILTMPIDMHGNYLSQNHLIIPDKKFATEVILGLSSVLPELLDYCHKILEDVQGNGKLYLLSNFYNSKFSSQDDEINLYEEVIRQTADPEATIIIKNHPRGSDTTINALVQRLIPTHKVIIIDEKRFNFYPIELWKPLVLTCEIYPIFSSSVISLFYLFSKKVIMPLNERLILKYINKHKASQTILGEEMCRQSIAALENWDGKSPIWKKSI